MALVAYLLITCLFVYGLVLILKARKHRTPYDARIEKYISRSAH